MNYYIVQWAYCGPVCGFYVFWLQNVINMFALNLFHHSVFDYIFF